MVGEETDVLRLSIPDYDLNKIIDKRIEDYDTFYGERKLFDERKRNEKYLFGRQIDDLIKEGKIKSYEAKNLDNVLYEIEASIKPLAMTQLPDLIVTPGSETDEAKEVATLLTTATDSDIKKRQNRKVLAMAFKHLPVYKVGVIKCIWNPELCGGLGDYEFVYIHPNNIKFDHTATEADADKMSFVAQQVPLTVQQVLMRFPKAKAKFIKELEEQEGIKVYGEDGKENWKALATPIWISEVWFTDYEEAIEGDWKRVEGTTWKYKDCNLGKMKNPYFDYTGEDQVFTYCDPQLQSSKRALSMPEMQASMLTGQFPENISQEKVFHNFFDAPRKPYFFMTYDQWGLQPLDETSRIEQNIRNQESLDKRGKIIQEKLNERGHHIWSKLGGFMPSDIQKMDHNNPDEDYLVDDDVNRVHKFVPSEPPTQQEFGDVDRLHQRMYAVSGSTAVRGEIQDNTAATNNQIAREADYTRADDLVDDTINPAAEWMAQWALHMIRTRYTQEHFRKILGKKGEVVFLKLHQNLIDDGMEVMIKATGTDKIKRQNNALEMARMQLTDPLSFFEDMDLDDPEGRTAKIIAFKSSMPLYLSAFVETGPTSTPELAAKLQQLTMQQQAPQPGQAPGGQPPQPGHGAPQQPQAPTPGNTAQVPQQPQAGPPDASVRNI